VALTEHLPNRNDTRTRTETQQRRSGAHGSVLAQLVGEAHVRAARLEKSRDELERRCADTPVPPSFVRALRRPDVAVIAEVKRSSPSRGAINLSLDASAHAVSYGEGGAAAVSVLTEPSRFAGSLRDLETISAAVAIPVLRKDFIVSEDQLLEARAVGAAAALLIARAVPHERLQTLTEFALAVGLEPFLEVHTEDEIAMTADLGVRVIGINNRDLETLEVDADSFARLAPLVPKKVILVAESGIQSRHDVEILGAAGADAVLVGSSLSAANDPAAAVRALVGVSRSPGGRRD
jgi:indole-3-glycerol phosphate synthase